MALYAIDTYDTTISHITYQYIRVRIDDFSLLRGMRKRTIPTHTLYQKKDVTRTALRVGGSITGLYENDNRVGSSNTLQWPSSSYFDQGINPSSVVPPSYSGGFIAGYVVGTRTLWDIEDYIVSVSGHDFSSTFPSPEVTGAPLTLLREAVYGADGDRMALVITPSTGTAVFAVAPHAPLSHAGDVVPWIRSQFYNTGNTSLQGSCTGPADLRIWSRHNLIGGVPDIAFIFDGSATDPQIGGYNRQPGSAFGTWYGPPPEVKYYSFGYKSLPTAGPGPTIDVELTQYVNHFSVASGYTQTSSVVATGSLSVSSSRVVGANTEYYMSGLFSHTPSALPATAVGYFYTIANTNGGVFTNGHWHRTPPILPMGLSTTIRDPVPLGGPEELTAWPYLLRVPR